MSAFLLTLCNMAILTVAYYRTWMPSAAALTSFLCYTLISGQRLTVSKAFTSIALLSQLESPMMILPGQIFSLLRGTSLTSVRLYVPTNGH